MRRVSEYLGRAAEFENLAAATADPRLRRRYADLADSYRLLADERKRMIAEGTLAEGDWDGPDAP